MIHEYSSILSAHSLGATENDQPLASVNVTPTENVPAGAQFAAAEILIPPQTEEFPEMVLYASNRNKGATNEEGDTIAILQFVSVAGQTGRFKIIDQVYTGLQQVRGMTFSDDGKYLVAGGAEGGGVKVFERKKGGMVLSEVAANNDVDKRTSFIWL